MVSFSPASCVPAPFDSIQCLLSRLQLFFFASLSFSLYFSSCVFHHCESLVCPLAFFLLLRSSIRSHVAEKTHLFLLVPLLFPTIAICDVTAPRGLWNDLDLQICSWFQHTDDGIPTGLLTSLSHHTTMCVCVFFILGFLVFFSYKCRSCR